MPKKILQIVDSAYRGTLEEQDDTVVWISHAMKGAGADLHVLLTGNAVNYAVKGQDASGLSFGQKKQTQPPRLDDDLAKLIAKQVEVHVVTDDLADRGIESSQLIPGLKMVQRLKVAGMFASYDQVWRW